MTRPNKIEVMKMNKRKKLHLISIFCIVLAVILCYILTNFPIFNPKIIYGNDSLIVREIDNYHMANGITGAFDENGIINFSIKSFSGSRTIRILDIYEGENLSCTWDISVNRGQFKLVLIDIRNGKIVKTICEGSGIGSINDYELSSAEYRIKAVGDNAAVEGQFEIELMK